MTIKRAISLLLILLLAFGLRLVNLNGRFLWYDEALAILFAEKSLAAMLNGTITLTNIPNVIEKRSISRSGISVITVVFKDATDIYWARQQVGERLKEAEAKIPAGFGDITLTGTTGRLLSVGVMIFGVTLFLRLAQVLFRPPKVRYECPECGLSLHDADAVHCKHCGATIHIRTEGGV